MFFVGLVGCGGPRSEPGAARPVVVPSNCSVRVSDAAGVRRELATVAPGGRVCVGGDLGVFRLEVTRSGTPRQPVEVLGDGRVTVAGITINADNVVVSGFNSVGGAAPGIWMKGTNITVENNKVRHPVGDDLDGLRFFGENLKILHNTFTDIAKQDGDPKAPDPPCIQTYDKTHSDFPPPNRCEPVSDCMQTFATGATAAIPNSGTSRHVLIDSNRCERVASSCLVAQGPHSLAENGSGQGQSLDITFTNNYCEAHYSQAVLVDDVQQVTIANNEIACTAFQSGNGVYKAFKFVNNSTHVSVEGNDVGSCVKREVSMDDKSQVGYRGPAASALP